MPLRWLLLIGFVLMAGAYGTQPVRRNFQSSDGVTLSVLETGRGHAGGDGLKIALIPGWSMPARIWQQQLETFGRSYHTLALDPRGQGQSQVPAQGYTAERRATDLKEFIQPLSNVLLVGWSLGAIEALQYVQMFGTGHLAGMVLVDSSVGEEPAPPSGGSFAAELRGNRDKTLANFVRAIFAKPRPVSEINELVAEAKRLPLEDSLALLSYPFQRAHWRRIVQSFDKPLLYIVTPQFEEQAKNLRKHRPATQVAVFRQAGHALFVDEPDRFNALIVKFAATIAPR